MLAFYIGEAPIWGDAPTGQRGVAYPAPHFDEPEHPNFRLWTFTPAEPDSPTTLCHDSDFESVGEGLEGIYQWIAVERCAEIATRARMRKSLACPDVPAFLRARRHLWVDKARIVAGVAQMV